MEGQSSRSIVSAQRNAQVPQAVPEGQVASRLTTLEKLLEDCQKLTSSFYQLLHPVLLPKSDLAQGEGEVGKGAICPMADRLDTVLTSVYMLKGMLADIQDRLTI